MVGKATKYKKLSRIFLVISIGAILITSVVFQNAYRSFGRDYDSPARRGGQIAPRPCAAPPFVVVYGYVGSTASIISLFLTFYYRYKDKKEKRKEKAEEERRKQALLELVNAPLTMPSKSGLAMPKQAVFDYGQDYKGYLTTITYSNHGNRLVKNVSVSVEQKEDETASPTLIKNDDIFPIEMLNVGDSFEIEVECYYPKAYRYFTVEWEDEKGKHYQKNRVMLSKNYMV